MENLFTKYIVSIFIDLSVQVLVPLHLKEKSNLVVQSETQLLGKRPELVVAVGRRHWILPPLETYKHIHLSHTLKQ